MTLLALDAETELCTSGQGAQAPPCAVAACTASRSTTPALRIGGQERLVPLCSEHATLWVGRV